MNDLNRTGKFIVDYVLPLTFVVGTGIGTYLFTGGEEEYPPVEEEILNQERDENLPLNDTNEVNRHEDEDITAKETDAPSWVNEVHKKLESIQQDITDIKEKLLRSSSPAVVAKLPDNPPEVLQVPIKQDPLPSLPLPEYQKQIHNAIYRFAYQLSDDLSCNVYELLDHTDFLQKELQKPIKPVLSKDYQDGIELLLLFIKNVMKHPDIPRYQRISMNNTNFKSVLKPLVGYHSILSSVGFQLKGIYYEFEWKITASDSKSGSSSQERKEEPKPLPTVEDALILLNQMIDLLTSLKEGTAKALQLIQQHRNIITTTSSSANISLIPPSSNTPAKIAANDQLSPLSSTTTSSSSQNNVKISPGKSNVALFPNSPAFMPATYHAPSFDEVIQKISKSDQSKSHSEGDSNGDNRLEEIQ